MNALIAKRLEFMRNVMMTYPCAYDLWLVAIALTAAFGHKVPWYMWGMAIFEMTLGVVYMKRANYKPGL